jgi:5-methylcytosine-specific restriction endonuclease McrA
MLLFSAMAQTPLGADKVAAKKFGLTLEDYQGRRASGLRRCTKCADWKPVESFGRDRSRPDGLAYRCEACRRVRVRQSTKGRVSAFKGRSHSVAAREAMSAARKGCQNLRRVGQKHSPETRQKISDRTRERAARGDACHSFKDGKLAERRDARFSQPYKRWRYDVFARDGFTCQKCGDDRGGNLHAHHIKSFADFPDLRFDVANGITLCEICHKAEHQR